MTPRARAAAMAGLGLALGFTLSEAGFSDWGEMHRAWTLGLGEGGPSVASLRPLLAFATAIAVAFLGFRALARRDAFPARPAHRGTVPGALLFGVGWALCGGCPAVALVQLGEGQAFAGWTLAGILAGSACARRLKARLGIRAGSCMGE